MQRNANARHPDVLAAHRRERARVRSEKGIRGVASPWPRRHDPLHHCRETALTMVSESGPDSTVMKPSSTYRRRARFARSTLRQIRVIRRRRSAQRNRVRARGAPGRRRRRGGGHRSTGPTDRSVDRTPRQLPYLFSRHGASVVARLLSNPHATLSMAGAQPHGVRGVWPCLAGRAEPHGRRPITRRRRRHHPGRGWNCNPGLPGRWVQPRRHGPRSSWRSRRNCCRRRPTRFLRPWRSRWPARFSSSAR